jgi:hypothetical protein
MQPSSRAPLVIPILIIVVGVAWLFSSQGFGPGINWAWTLGLGIIGILTFVLSGFDKFSVVVGPFFLLASLLSVLRQTGSLSLDVEVPLLVISIGVLMLVARVPGIPSPAWFAPDPSSAEQANAPRRLRLGDGPATPPGEEAGGDQPPQRS